ncbi:rRNA maturation RNase YbeY [Ascidiimonas aurantiaca]|uniref:rRNA maturation RNase YbeY n=1 Tax=Ascidiimonas aurantiaca TaxID=1685432 RepID=UPI0030EF397A
MGTIDFVYETNFGLTDQSSFKEWIQRVASSEGYIVDEIAYVFCDDEYLLDINKKYLDHDTYTDIISFDYTENKHLKGDIFISIDRVRENATLYNVSFEEELKRVMIHGVLHCIGYKDKTDKEKRLMREKENEKINMFHVKHNP